MSTGVELGALVAAGAVLGTGACVQAGAYVGPSVRLGERTRVAPGAVVNGDVVTGADVVIGAGSTVQAQQGRIELRDGSSVGAGATVVGSLVIERGAQVGAGAFVDRSVPALAIVSGNPAVIAGYADTTNESVSSARVAPTSVTDGSGPRAVRMNLVTDLRGDLTVGHFEREVPFRASRFFIVFNVPGQKARGAHAHRKCEQFLIAARGSLHVVWDDGERRGEVVLDQPATGFYLPPMVWGIQYKHSADAVLLVFASDPYDPADYIRDYDEFLAAVHAPSA